MKLRNHFINSKSNSAHHFGDTNDVVSTTLSPVSDSRFMNLVLVSIETISFSFCRPSRGPTSTSSMVIEREKIRKKFQFKLTYSLTYFHGFR